MTPLQALQKYYGYTQFRHQQEAIIKQVMSGGDALVLMPTGGGKSLCYQLPAVLLPGLTLVISPLIALMKDQVDALNLTGIPAAYLNSTQSSGEQTNIISRVKNGEIKLLYLAPERLFSSESRLVSFLKQLPVSLIAIDEAHCISHWGHDFRPEYLMLAHFKTEFPLIPVIALTATADELTRQDIRDKLALHQPAEFVSSFNRPNISYTVAPKKNAYQQLLHFLNERRDESGIIYCLSRAATEDLATDLRAQGYAASAYHAGLDTDTKARNQEQFLRDEIKIMVATIAFGMGINKSNVRYVVHYDLPKNIEGYYQETGRAGRDGLPSEALLFFSAGDAFKLKNFARVEGNEEQSAIMLKKLDDMVKYCQLQTCRRQYLMHYFNEPFGDHCGSCDVCLTEYKTIDGTVLAQKALSAVARLDQRFGVNYVIDLLRGSRSEKIWADHKQLKTYGIGADVSKADWQRYIAQLVTQGYLRTTDDQYPILKLTDQSEDVLKGRQKVEFSIAEEVELATELQTPVYEAGLLQDLKTIRLNLAMKENVPAYLILSDATLLEIATYLPQTPNELSKISGFGEVKLVRYGDAFLQATLAYCHQYGLASKMDTRQSKPATRTKSPRASSGATQRETLELYQGGLSMDEIAQQRQLSVTTIQNHLCGFIETGELDVHELVTAKKFPVIQDAVEKYGTERLAPLKEVLGDAYTYAEIKAVISWLKKGNA